MYIREMQTEDWPAVQRIYDEGISTGNATFEQQAPDWAAWDEEHLSHSRLVAIDGADITGWAALSPVSGRCVYGGVAEVSVYVDTDQYGKGIGNALLQALVDVSERNNIWTLQAGIFRENIASLNLHKKCGFREVGFREKLGKLNGRWRDVILLERRSPVAGIE